MHPFLVIYLAPSSVVFKKAGSLLFVGKSFYRTFSFFFFSGRAVHACKARTIYTVPAFFVFGFGRHSDCEASGFFFFLFRNSFTAEEEESSDMMMLHASPTRVSVG